MFGQEFEEDTYIKDQNSLDSYQAPPLIDDDGWETVSSGSDFSISQDVEQPSSFSDSDDDGWETVSSGFDENMISEELPDEDRSFGDYLTDGVQEVAGSVNAAGLSALDTLSLGYFDEAAGFAHGIIKEAKDSLFEEGKEFNLDSAFKHADDRTDLLRQELAEAKEQYPISSLVGGVAGGVVNPLGRAVSGLRWMQKGGSLIKGAKNVGLAGAEGYVYGTGSTDSKDVSDRLKAGIDDAGIAAAGAALLPASFRAGKAIYKVGKEGFRDSVALKKNVMQKVLQQVTDTPQEFVDFIKKNDMSGSFLGTRQGEKLLEQPEEVAEIIVQKMNDVDTNNKFVGSLIDKVAEESDALLSRRQMVNSVKKVYKDWDFSKDPNNDQAILAREFLDSIDGAFRGRVDRFQDGWNFKKLFSDPTKKGVVDDIRKNERVDMPTFRKIIMDMEEKAKGLYKKNYETSKPYTSDLLSADKFKLQVFGELRSRVRSEVNKVAKASKDPKQKKVAEKFNNLMNAYKINSDAIKAMQEGGLGIKFNEVDKMYRPVTLGKKMNNLNFKTKLNYLDKLDDAFYNMTTKIPELKGLGSGELYNSATMRDFADGVRIYSQMASGKNIGRGSQKPQAIGGLMGTFGLGNETLTNGGRVLGYLADKFGRSTLRRFVKHVAHEEAALAAKKYGPQTKIRTHYNKFKDATLQMLDGMEKDELNFLFSEFDNFTKEALGRGTTSQQIQDFLGVDY